MIEAIDWALSTGGAQHVIGHVGNFSSVLGLEFLHDVSNVYLDGAFTQVEFVRNNLV